MKTPWLYLLLVSAGVALFTLAPVSGQNAPAEVSPQMEALVAELTAQNKQLTANQAALEEKLDALAETIRQARLFVARAAGKVVPQ